MDGSNQGLESGIEDVIAKERQNSSNHYQLLESSQRREVLPANLTSTLIYNNSPVMQLDYVRSQEPELREKFRLSDNKLEYTGDDILNDSYALAAAVWDHKSELLMQYDGDIAFLQAHIDGFDAAYKAECDRIAKLNVLINNRINCSDGRLTGKGHDLLKDSEQTAKAYKRYAKNLAKDIAGTTNPFLIPAYIAITLTAEKKSREVKHTKEKLKKLTKPEKKHKSFYSTTRGKIAVVGVASLLAGVAAAYAATQLGQHDNPNLNNNLPLVYFSSVGDVPGINANTTVHENVTMADALPADYISNHVYNMHLGSAQWTKFEGNSTDFMHAVKFFDVDAWAAAGANPTKLPDYGNLSAKALKDAKTVAWKLGEDNFIRYSAVEKIEYLKNNSNVQNIFGLHYVDVNATIRLITEGAPITNTFPGGGYNIHNITFHPEFTVNVNPLSIPDKVCDIPVLNNSARVAAENNYLIDRSNKTIGEYNNINLKSWDGKDASEFLKLSKAKEFVNQSLALANGKSIDNARPWFNPERPWQPPAYGDVVIEKVNDTTALSKALIDMFPVKKGIQNMSEDSDIISNPTTGGVSFAQNPSENITYLSPENYTKLVSDGWRFNKTAEDLGTVEPAHLNQTVWKELNASASKEAWDRVSVQAKSNTNYIDAAFAKIVATKRNATAWNYSAELFMKRKNVFNIENLSEEPSIIPDYANGTVKFTKNPLDNITLLDEATYNKLATDGWRFTEKTEYLGWLDPANPLNFDTWKNPNATASKEAWDRTIADAKSNITAYDAALAKIVATKRNATVWDYSAELAQKRKDVIKQIAPDPGNYNLKPEQRIINKTEMENNHSKGFVINQYSMLLNQLDLGNPNITNNESALLASAQSLAEKYIRKLLNETPDAVNGYYEMSAERNKTNPNLINAMFVAKVQKLYQGGLLTVVGSPIADYGAWLNATDNDIVSNDKIDTIQDNDIALFWYGNQTIKYNGSTLTASEVYSLLEGMPFPDATKYFEFKAVPFNNFTPPASWGCTPLKKLSPYYELDKWPKKVFLLTEILKVKN